jgi:hypothetical protein
MESNNEVVIDIMRTSASRPDFLEHSTEKLIKHLKYTGLFRWLIHEDQLDKNRSDECMKYINECGVYNVIDRHYPPLGQGHSLGWLLNKVRTKYVLNFEDDFEPIKDIDIDILIKLMNDNPDINQIAFHKRPIMKKKPHFIKKQVIKNGITLVTNQHWAFTPSIFRLSFLKPKWQNFPVDPHWKMNGILKQHKKLRDADWVMKNVGTYFLGGWKFKYMKKENGGNLTEKEYDKLDNGFYAYHLGQKGSVRLNTYNK